MAKTKNHEGLGDALVGVAEIEERYGLDRMQISRLLDAEEFPTPVADLAAGRIWNGNDVDRAIFQLRAEGRITSDGRIVPRRFLET